MSEKEDFQDVMAEEIARGRRQPKKAVTLARQRMIRKVARYARVIRAARKELILRLFVSTG